MRPVRSSCPPGPCRTLRGRASGMDCMTSRKLYRGYVLATHFLRPTSHLPGHRLSCLVPLGYDPLRICSQEVLYGLHRKTALRFHSIVATVQPQGANLGRVTRQSLPRDSVTPWVRRGRACAYLRRSRCASRCHATDVSSPYFFLVANEISP